MRALGKLFYPVYERYLDDHEDFKENIEKDLSQALIPESVEMFMSKGLGYSLITGILIWFTLMVTLALLFFLGILPNSSILGINIQNDAIRELIIAIRIPAIILVSAVVVGGVLGVITFVGYVKYPAMLKGGRKREINMLLPDALSYMYALSIGGLNQMEIFRSVAAADDTYGEISKEFKVMLKETEYFDTDYRTAIYDHSQRTPSKELGMFLSDMISILSSGGDLESFLKDQRRKFMRAAKQQQEQTLETLELFGEMYMTLSLFPLLLIIVMMTMSIMGEADMLIMYAVVYALIPILGVGFLVMISTVKQDTVGDGILTLEGREKEEMVSGSLSASRLARDYASKTPHEIFKQIKQDEDTKQIIFILKNPHKFFVKNPTYTLGFTVPLAITIMGLMLLNNAAPMTLDDFIANPVYGSLVYFYIPSYIIITPLAIFFEINYSRRHAVTDRLSEVLRKLANANDTGQTLLSSLITVSESSKGSLATELEEMYYKVQYGMTLKEAFIEFNNKYRIPRLARTTRLIVKAQETTEDISEVLTTAAEVSEIQDDLRRERKSRARMQVAIILMTFLALLGVMAILQTQFVSVMAELSTSASEGAGSGGGGGGGASFEVDLNVNELSMLFFHAVTFQAVLSGLISGYIRSANLLSGLKYVVILQSIALTTWLFVG